MLIRPVLAATTAAAAMVVVPVTAAQAQAWRHADATGDVQSVAASSDANPTPAPDAVDPDVSKIRVTHGPRKVTMRVQFVDLAAGKQVSYLFMFRLRTDERLHRDVVLDAGPGMWRGQASFSSPHRDLRCKGLGHNIDYVQNVVTVTVPRSCLSRPRWVQAGAGAAKFTGLGTTTQDMSTVMLYADDAGSDKIGNNLAWSPRIRKG